MLRPPAILILTFTSSWVEAQENAPPERQAVAGTAPGTSTKTAPHPRQPAARAGVGYKWWALSCTSLGMLLAATNSGTLIIALPDLERSLHSSLLALVWVILAYLIAATVLVLMAGRL